MIVIDLFVFHGNL